MSEVIVVMVVVVVMVLVVVLLLVVVAVAVLCGGDGESRCFAVLDVFYAFGCFWGWAGGGWRGGEGMWVDGGVGREWLLDNSFNSPQPCQGPVCTDTWFVWHAEMVRRLLRGLCSANFAKMSYFSWDISNRKLCQIQMEKLRDQCFHITITNSAVELAQQCFAYSD